MSTVDIEQPINDTNSIVDGSDAQQVPDIADDSSHCKDGSALKKNKKVGRNYDIMMKSIRDFSPDSKVEFLSTKCFEQFEESRQNRSQIKQITKQLISSKHENQQLQTEHGKVLLARNKLEGLCRELHRQAKVSREENLLRAKEDEERKRSVVSQFQSTISEIQSQMEANQSANERLRNENTDMGEKLKELISRCESREDHMLKVLKHKEVSGELLEAKLKQASLLSQEQSLRHAEEKKVLLEKLTEAHTRLNMAEKTEQTLKEQLAIYSSKYEEFHSTLNQSSEVFGTFKAEIDTLNKKCKLLDKDCAGWKSRWEETNKGMLLMLDQRSKQEDEIVALQKRASRLESLCRALQAERKGEGKLEDILVKLLADTERQVVQEDDKKVEPVAKTEVTNDALLETSLTSRSDEKENNKDKSEAQCVESSIAGEQKSEESKDAEAIDDKSLASESVECAEQNNKEQTSCTNGNQDTVSTACSKETKDADTLEVTNVSTNDESTCLSSLA